MVFIASGVTVCLALVNMKSLLSRIEKHVSPSLKEKKNDECDAHRDLEVYLLRGYKIKV